MNLSTNPFSTKRRTFSNNNPLNRRKILSVADTLRAGLIISAFSIFAVKLQSAANGQDDNDIVAFFKQAISSPPPVEHFVASQKMLQEAIQKPIKGNMKFDSSPLFYEGGRSGTNCFLHIFQQGSSNASTSGIIGRNGAGSYQLTPNSIIQSLNSDNPSQNPISSASALACAQVNQFLNMGLSDINPGSVVWNSNEFKAVRVSGPSVYGRLDISNGLPRSLEISVEKSASPYKTITYSYPSSATLLQGFPQKMIIFRKFEDRVEPFLEIALLDIKLATNSLIGNTFDPARFITTNIAYTNIYSNGVEYSLIGGKTLKVFQPPRHPKTNHALPRMVIVFCLIALAVIPVLIWFRYHNNISINQKPK